MLNISIFLAGIFRCDHVTSAGARNLWRATRNLWTPHHPTPWITTIRTQTSSTKTDPSSGSTTAKQTRAIPRQMWKPWTPAILTSENRINRCWIPKHRNNVYYFVGTFETKLFQLEVRASCVYRTKTSTIPIRVVFVGRERGGISPSLVWSKNYSTTFFYLPTPRQSSLSLVSPTNTTLTIIHWFCKQS